MGRAQIASDPPPLSEGPSVKRANVEKKCPIPSWQALTPLGNCGKNVPKTILASLYTSPPLPIWKQHISKRDFLKTEQSQCQRGSSKRVRARCKAKQRRMWLVGSDKINSSLFNFKAEATKSEEGKAMYLVR